MLVDLAEATDLADVGAKAANLGRIMRAGIDVPEGFVITAAVHDATRAAARHDGGEAVADLEAAIPTRWRDQIAEAVARIGPPVAVRSSGVDEDGTDASFAGQFHSHLSRRTPDQVLAALAQCWRSASTGYAHNLRTRPESMTMPVLVQRMVPAEHAGVMFTQDPVTGDPSQLVIEAVAGLGDALCDGRVTPDRIRLDKVTGALRSVDRAGGATPAPTIIARLHDLAIVLGRLFGAPQDIEWAAVGERVWVLQSRPITVTPGPSGVAPSLIDMAAVFGTD